MKVWTAVSEVLSDLANLAAIAVIVWQVINRGGKGRHRK